MATVKRIAKVPNANVEELTGSIYADATEPHRGTNSLNLVLSYPSPNAWPGWYISATRPLKLRSIKLGIIWLYQEFLWAVQGQYTDEQCRLLIIEAVDKERRKWESLERKFGSRESQNVAARPRIPESVRIEVWRRDGGKCARCASRENLEYDHIVPVSKGGSNTARNIELLCEKCNRSKGGNIG
jgi:hypothetical protein